VGLFGLITAESRQRSTALKNVLTLGVNTVAGVTYVLVASDRINGLAAALVAGGSVIGGFLGSGVGRRLSAPVLRGTIVVLGVVAIFVLLSR
jgi:uncharacterized membrane protein YfcA